MAASIATFLLTALITTTGPFADDTKDPGFLDDGRPLGGDRYAVFGDLRGFYMKRFVAAKGALEFDAGERRIEIAGLPSQLDSPWAPYVRRIGDRLVLLYCAGEMHEGDPILWPTFKLRTADLPYAEAARAASAGKPLRFTDRGAFLTDLETFPDGDFGVIDPHLFVDARGRAWLTYTVVRYGVPDKRWHEELVRVREVSPADPTKPLGPDRPLWDGKANTADDGVAEAQELGVVNGRTVMFVSSRPGDKDQLVWMAPCEPAAGPVDRAAAVKVLVPEGGAKAVGSTGVATIEGATYLIYQELGADERFRLRWKNLALVTPRASRSPSPAPASHRTGASPSR